MTGTWLIRFLVGGEAQIRTALFDTESVVNAYIADHEQSWHFWRVFRLHSQGGSRRQ